MSENSKAVNHSGTQPPNTSAVVFEETRLTKALLWYVELMKENPFEPFPKPSEPTYVRLKDPTKSEKSDLFLIDTGPYALKAFLNRFHIEANVPYLDAGELKELHVRLDQKDFSANLAELEAHVAKTAADQLANGWASKTSERQQEQRRQEYAAELEAELAERGCARR